MQPHGFLILRRQSLYSTELETVSCSSNQPMNLVEKVSYSNSYNSNIITSVKEHFAHKAIINNIACFPSYSSVQTDEGGR